MMAITPPIALEESAMPSGRPGRLFLFSLIVFAAVMAGIRRPPQLSAADQPQWGQAGSRNMVSAERGLADWFEPGKPNSAGEVDLKTTRNVQWVARLGAQTYGTPVIAEGKVFVGTNNGNPRDPRCEGDRGVMMCFDEKTGRFLWQLVVPKLFDIKYADWYHIGLTSTPVVENGRLYSVTNRGEVVCLDANGMADGNQGPFTDEGRHMVPGSEKPVEPGPKDADILWLYDMVGQLGVRPHNAANCSVLLRGDLLYVCTSNGVEWTHKKVANPEAPSLIVLDKRSGKLVARDNFGIGANIIHGQWSSPAVGEVAGRPLGFFGAGNGYLYAFEPLDGATLGETVRLTTFPGGQNVVGTLRVPSDGTRSVPATLPRNIAAPDQAGPLKNVWRFNGHPLAQHQDDVPIEHAHSTRSYEVVANPVFYNNRVYTVFTQEGYHNQHHAWITCIDPTGHGDRTRSGLVWSYDKLTASVSTPSIADGLVYIADYDGHLHCLDAETGRCYWVHKVAGAGSTSGSTLVADGRIYLGTDQPPQLLVMATGREPRVINRIDLPEKVLCSPAAANGILYITTCSHLYAVRGNEKDPNESRRDGRE
jgi:outer membrane protein assembly factor BamB